MRHALALHPSISRRGSRGVSLVELMVAITLGLVILTTVLLVLSNATSARAEIDRVSQRLENGRYAIEFLTQELQSAAFYGEFQPVGTPPVPLPDPCALDPAVWETAMLMPVQGFNASTGFPGCVPGSRMAGSDVLSLRRVRGCIANTAGCDPVIGGEAYLQVSMCASAAQRYVLALAGSDPFALTEKDCVSPAALRRYLVNTYFVSSNNGAGRDVPTLKRLELAGGAFRDVAIAEGIERIRFEYGMDTNGDGGPEQFTADVENFTYPGCAACDPGANWASVMAVRVHVLARALDISPGHIDTKVYTLGRDEAGSAVLAGPFNDGYRRNVYTSVVRVMNPSTRRETP